MAAIQQEVFKNIKRIQIHTTRLVNDLFAGAYHSIFKGAGMEFEEVREYISGDEIRNIDWNVSARMRSLYVKKFREERELSIMLVVDVSASSRFGSGKRSKKELIAEIGAVLAFSAIKNNDKVGLILFSEEVEKYIPPKKGLTHVLRVIRELLLFEPKYKGTNLTAALTFLGKVQRKMGICFLISDFICSGYAHAIQLTAKHYDLITIGVTDPFEMQFPDMGLITMKDLETGATRVIDTSNTEAFCKAAVDRIREHKKLMERIGADFVQIEADQDYTKALHKFFSHRKQKK